MYLIIIKRNADDPGKFVGITYYLHGDEHSVDPLLYLETVSTMIKKLTQESNTNQYLHV